jgi:hypothetical protein
MYLTPYGDFYVRDLLDAGYELDDPPEVQFTVVNLEHDQEDSSSITLDQLNGDGYHADEFLVELPTECDYPVEITITLHPPASWPDEVVDQFDDVVYEHEACSTCEHTVNPWERWTVRVHWDMWSVRG